MGSKVALIAVLLVIYFYEVYGQPLPDPLRGPDVKQLIGAGGDVLLLNVVQAQRNADEGYCDYFYEGHVVEVFRGEQAGAGRVKFASPQKLRVGDYYLIVRNNNSDQLNRAAQGQCRNEAARVLGRTAFLARQDEIIFVAKVGKDYFAFLPSRRFSSALPGVYDREINTPSQSKYVGLWPQMGTEMESTWNLTHCCGGSAKRLKDRESVREPIREIPYNAFSSFHTAGSSNDSTRAWPLQASPVRGSG